MDSELYIDARVGDQMLIALRQIIRAVDIHSKRLVKRVGLTAPQLIVLKVIFEQRASTVGSIAKQINLSQATVTPIVERLVKADYLIREKDKSDKRKTHLIPTEKARTAIQAAPSVLQETFLKRLEELQSWEQNLLLSSIQRIANMMDASDLIE